MSVYLYDNAIVEAFRQVLNDDRILITPAENVMRTIARLENDDIQFPLISLTRRGMSLQPSQFAMRYDGLPVEHNYMDGTIKKLQAMPLKIDYQIDIWTRNREENDNLVRELVFWLSTHPAIRVDIPYDLNEKHVFSLFLDNSIDDNSDIISHKNSGEYFRQTLSAYVDDAYLWKTTKSEAVTLSGDGIDLYSYEKKTDEPYIENIIKNEKN